MFGDAIHDILRLGLHRSPLLEFDRDTEKKPWLVSDGLSCPSSCIACYLGNVLRRLFLLMIKVQSLNFTT